MANRAKVKTAAKWYLGIGAGWAGVMLVDRALKATATLIADKSGRRKFFDVMGWRDFVVQPLADAIFWPGGAYRRLVQPALALIREQSPRTFGERAESYFKRLPIAHGAAMISAARTSAGKMLGGVNDESIRPMRGRVPGIAARRQIETMRAP